MKTNRLDRTAQQTVLFVSQPVLWPWWPFLPVVRRINQRIEDGFVFDTLRCLGMTGYSATVFIGNIYTLPESLQGLLEQPKEVFDTAEELVAAGWRVD